MKWILIAAAVFSVVTTAIYLYNTKNNEQSFSVDKLWQEHGMLAKQDMRFLSRGQNFAHYAVTAISDKGDSVSVQYRVPANNRKLKALLWVYDAPRDVNMSAILDQNTRAQHAAIIGYNIHENFERDEQGVINSSRANLYNGLATTRREVDMLLQMLKKHQVIDSTQIFVAGQGIANTPVLGAVTDKASGLRACGLIDIARGMKKWQEIDKSGLATSSTIASTGIRGKLALIEPKGSQGFSWPDGGASLTGQPYSMENVAGLSETDILRNGLESALVWVVGDDTLAAPIKVDTTFTKVVRVAS
ncbi:MAG: hypothetical protein IPP40_01830 [bacterium]|nr:hypothetical protein [bacterium]